MALLLCLCSRERSLGLSEVFTRNGQSAVGRRRCTTSAREQPPGMFTIPSRQRLSVTRWLAIRTWNVIHGLESSSLIQKRYMWTRRVLTSFNWWREIETREEKKREAERETQIYTIAVGIKKTRVQTYTVFKEAKSKKKIPSTTTTSLVFTYPTTNVAERDLLTVFRWERKHSTSYER